MTLGIRAFPLPHAEAHLLAWSPDGEAFAVASARSAWVLPLGGGRPRPLGVRLGSITSLAWTEAGLAFSDEKAGRTLLIHPDGRLLAEADGAGALAAAPGALLRLGPVSRPGLAPPGPQSLDVLDLATLAPIRKLPLAGQALSVQGPLALVAGDEGVNLVDWQRGVEIHRQAFPAPLPGAPAPVLQAAALSSDGRRYLASSYEHTWLGEFGAAPRWLPEHGPVGFIPGGLLIGSSLLDPEGSPRQELLLAGYHPRDRCAALSPDCRRFAVRHHGDLYAFDLEAIAARRPLPGAVHEVSALALSPDGQCLAAGTENHELLFWDTASASLRASVRLGASVGPLAFTPDGRRLLVGTDHGVDVWDPAAARRVAVWTAPELRHLRALSARGDRALAVGVHRAVLFQGDGRPLASFGPWPAGSEGSSVNLEGGDLHPGGDVVLIVRDGQEALLLGLDGAPLGRLPAAQRGAFHHGGEAILISDGRGSTLRRYPLRDEPTETQAHFDRIASIEGGLLWSYDQDVGLIPLDPLENGWTRRFHDAIRALAAAPGHPALYTGGRARWIAERDRRRARLRRALPAGGGGKVTSLAFDASGDLLAVGDHEGRVHLWRLAPTPARLSMLDGTPLQPEGTAFAPGEVGEVKALAFPGALIAACGNKVLRWETPADLDLGRDAPASHELSAQGVSADGRRTFSDGSFGAPIEVHDTETGELLATVPGADSRERWIDLSPDGERLLVAACPGEGAELSLWSLNGPRRLALMHVDRPIRHARLLPEGSVILWLDPSEVPGSAEPPGGLLARWDVAREVVERWLPSSTGAAGSHEVRVGGGKALFWGSGPARLVDLGSGQVVAALPPHEAAAITAAAISADGKRAVTADWTGEIRLWDAANGEWVASFCSTSDGGTWVRTETEQREEAGPYREAREIPEEDEDEDEDEDESDDEDEDEDEDQEDSE